MSVVEEKYYDLCTVEETIRVESDRLVEILCGPVSGITDLCDVLGNIDDSVKRKKAHEASKEDDGDAINQDQEDETDSEAIESDEDGGATVEQEEPLFLCDEESVLDEDFESDCYDTSE